MKTRDENVQRPSVEFVTQSYMEIVTRKSVKFVTHYIYVEIVTCKSVKFVTHSYTGIETPPHTGIDQNVWCIDANL